MTAFNEGPPPSPGKTARNEGRKLYATAFNNLGVALLLAAFVQPVLFYVQQRRPIDLATVAVFLIFASAAAACFRVGQAIVKRLED